MHKTPYRDMAMSPLQNVKYPYRLSTVFPPLTLDSNGCLNGIRRSSTSSPRKLRGALDTDIEILDMLRIVDYRYSRFALDPRSGLFHMTRSSIYSLMGTKKTHIRSGIGEIPIGMIYHPYNMVFLNLCGPNVSYYLVTTRSTLRANLQCLY
jgi:hypothetical protein